MGKQWKQWQIFFLDSKITADGDYSHEIKRHLLLGRKVTTNLLLLLLLLLLSCCPTLCNPIDGSPSGSTIPGILQARTLERVAISFSNAWKWKVKVKSLSILKSRDITLSTKVYLVKGMVFPVVMYGCESWTIKKAECQRIDAFELWCWRKLECPLECKEIQPVNPRENQSWIFIERIDAETETPILWPPDKKNWLIQKDPDAGKDWRQGEKRTTEDEIVGWHPQLNGHEFE